MGSYAQSTQAQPLTAEQKDRKRHSAVRKAGGDDSYSWALFVRGRQTYNGMTRSEANWRRDVYIKEGGL